MIVVADTGPINYLVLVGEIDLLHALFQTVLVTPAVAAELQNPKAPAAVRAFIESHPAWLKVRALTSPVRAELAGLDLGKAEAIELALENDAGLVLMDDAKGRNQAESMRLAVFGTIGILRLGAKSGRVDFRSATERLSNTNFRYSRRLRAEISAFLREIV